MQVRLRKSAVKDLKKLDSRNRQRINSKLKILSAFPDVPNIKKLTNFEPVYRMRVGDYRVLFDIVESDVEIARVLHRRESY